MAAVVRTRKRLDTSKKNSLSRLLDSLPQLVEDQGVSPERLVEARKSCRVAWDQYVLAHDALNEIREEDDDPDEEEYAALESRKETLSGALVEAITVRTRNRDALKLHQEKEAEDERVRQEKQEEQERLHQAKLDKIASHRLRLANLQRESNEELNKLLESLTMEEPPSIHQLGVGENTVINVRGAIRDYMNLSWEVAQMSPEIATEVMNMATNVSSNCKRLENEILIKISEFKEKLYPPPPPTPTYVPDAREGAVAKKEGSFKLEKRRLPKFKGTLREYPTFKKDWQTQMAPK